MTDIAQLGIAVDTSQTTLAARELDKLVAAGGKAASAITAMESAASRAAGAFGLMTSAFGVSQLIATTDQYTKFTAQLKLATNGANDYAAAMDSVRQASKLAQQDLASMGTLYARIAKSTEEIGTSQQQLSDITKVVGLSLKVSGATAAESASAMLQLSQSFASGTLRGEEFNAVNEAAPRLMQALANGMGVPIGALKTMASEGMITSKIMADALPGSLKALVEESKKVETIGGAFVLVKNNILELVGTQSQASGTVKALTSGIGVLAENLNVLAAAMATVGAVKLGTWMESLVVQTYSSVTANRALALSNLATATSQAEATAASVATTTARVAELRSAVLATSGNMALEVTLNGLIPAQARAVAAAEAHAVALAELSVAQRGASISSGIASTAIGALGGPIGAIITVLGLGVAAWMAWGNSAKKETEEAASKTEQSTKSMIASINEQIKKIDERNAALNYKPKIDATSAEQERLGKLQLQIEDLGKKKTSNQVEEVRRLTEINKLTAEQGELEQALSIKSAKSAEEKRRLEMKNAEPIAQKLRMESAGIKPEYFKQLKDYEIALKAGAMTQAEYTAGLTELAKKTYEASAAGKDAKNSARESAKESRSAAKANSEENQSLKERQTIYAEIADVSSDYYSKLSTAQKQLKSGGISEAMYIKYVEELIQKQPFATAQVKAATEAWKEQEKEREKASKAVEKAYEDEVSGAEKSAKSVTDKVAQLKIEEEAQKLVTGQNIALSAAIEQVMIKRLEEQAIVAKDAGKQELLDSLTNEIAARKELTEYTGRKEDRDASSKAAKKAAEDWKSASDKISNDLTDALMRGFESGKDFAKNMRDVIVNMFKTMVLKPTVTAFVRTVTGVGGAGGASAANAAGGSDITSMFSGPSASAWLTDFGGSVTSMASSIGSTIGGEIGAELMMGADSIGQAAGMMGDALGYGTAIFAAAEGKWGEAAGAAIGTYLGGPIGSMIGSKIGAFVDQAFAGETRTGSRLETTAAGTRYAEGPSGGRLNASLEDKITKQTFDGINNLLKNLGSKEVLGKFVSGLETSDKGRGGVFAGGTLYGGATFGDVQSAAAYKFNKDMKPEDAIKAYIGELNIATVEALKAATDLPKYAQRVLGGLDMPKLTPDAAVEALQVISEYPNKILELAGTSRDALVQKFTEGMMDKEIGAQKAGQNVADMLVASIEQSVYQRGMGQVFDIMNQGIITPILDAMVTGTALSDAISQESIDATIARATAAATALGDLFKNEQFQNVLTGLKTNLGAALGGVAAQVGYEPKYQIAAAKEIDKAAQDAAKAAEDARKKWQDITDSLLGDKTQLGIDLLRAQGKEEAAVAAERAKAIDGYDAYQISLHDANQALKKQISTQESLNALNSESADLQIQLMQAQGQQEQAVAKARQLATKGMGDAEVATYDYNKSLEKQIANQEQLNGLRDDAASLEVELLRALGKEESALAKEREIAIKGMDDLSIAQYDANQSARKLIGQVQDLSGAFDSAVAALASPEQKLSMGYTKALGTLSDAGLNITAEQAQTYTNAQILEFIGSVSQMGDVSADTRTKVISAAQAIGELNNQALDMLINRIQKESDTRTAAWQKELNVAQERAGIEQTALQLIGNTSELRKRELEALDATNRALQERVYAVQDASDGVDKTLALVQRSVDAEKTAISKAAQAQIDAITNGTDARSKAIDAAKKSVTDLTGIFDDVTNAVKTLRQNVLPEAAQMAQARAYISMALSVAQAGGQVNSDKLKESLAVVTKDTADTYATGSEFRFAQARQANELERLGNAMGAQKDKAQATLDAAENAVTLAAEQIKAIEKARDDQIAALDAQLKAAQDSVSVMRGVDISVIGVGDAIGVLDRAMAVYESTRDALAREQLTTGQNAVNRLDAMIVADQKNTADIIAAIRERAAAQVIPPITAPSTVVANAAPAESAAGGGSANLIQGASNAVPSISNSEIASAVSQHLSAGGSLMDVYNAAQQYGVSSGQLAAATGVSQSDILAWTASQNLPSFDIGTNYVPRDMIAQIHEGEAIVPKAFNPAANGSADNSELISEIRNLRAEVQRLQQIAQTGNIEQRRAADAVNGRPEAPMLVAVVETV